MSNYPIWWDTPITVYNKYEDVQTHVVTWHRTAIGKAFWKYVKNKVTVGSETLETEKIVCRIRKDSKFLEKSEWVKLPNDMMNKYFTLGSGDIIARGIVSDEIDEYTEGMRSNDFLAKYKTLNECMEVEAVSINVGKGRGNPHYLAEGI